MNCIIWLNNNGELIWDNYHFNGMSGWISCGLDLAFHLAQVQKLMIMVLFFVLETKMKVIKMDEYFKN